MLFALISIVWLAVMALLWALCRMAQRGDESPPSADHGDPPTGDGVVVWGALPELSLQDTRHTSRAASSQSMTSDDVPLTAHGIR